MSRTPYPLRLPPEVEVRARRLADEQDRSVNWVLSKLVQLGLANLEAQKENAPAAVTAEAPI